MAALGCVSCGVLGWRTEGKETLGVWRKEAWRQCSLGHSPSGNTFLRDAWNPDPIPVLFPKFLDRDVRVPEKPLYTRGGKRSHLALGLGATWAG